MIFRRPILLTIALLALTVLPIKTDNSNLHWVTGYWYSPPVWGNLPVSGIDFSSLTHLVHHAVSPRSDGTLDPQSLKFVAAYAPDLIRTAHQHGVKVLLGIAQQPPDDSFRQATIAASMPRVVSSIMRLVSTYGYDGVDLDWETSVAPEQFVALVRSLRAQLDAMKPKGLLAGAFFDASDYLMQTQSAFDQINVMTYDMCSVSEGFSWHNAALQSSDVTKRTVDWRVKRFIARIPGSKVGLGIPFYGYIWTGITRPAQTWDTAPTFKAIDYHVLAADPTLWRDQYKHRDSSAGSVPYLSIEPQRTFAGSGTFVTYDDEISVAAKVQYAKSHGLGGVMIWELSGDYFPKRNPQHPLLQAVKNALHGS